jgi:hypothetical protein
MTAEPHHGSESERIVTGRDVYERSRRVGREAARFALAVREAEDDWEVYLRRCMRFRPYATLATAAGFGYVLGAALPGPVARFALGIGTRMAVTGALGSLFSERPEPTAASAGAGGEPFESGATAP